jgi:hypothetical protein
VLTVTVSATVSVTVTASVSVTVSAMVSVTASVSVSMSMTVSVSVSATVSVLAAAPRGGGPWRERLRAASAPAGTATRRTVALGPGRRQRQPF